MTKKFCVMSDNPSFALEFSQERKFSSAFFFHFPTAIPPLHYGLMRTHCAEQSVSDFVDTLAPVLDPM